MAFSGGLEWILSKKLMAFSLAGMLALSACANMANPGGTNPIATGTLPQPKIYPQPQIYIVSSTPAAIPTETSIYTVTPSIESTLESTLTPATTQKIIQTETPTNTYTPAETCEEEKKIVVDLSEQRIYAVVDRYCLGEDEIKGIIEREFVNSAIVSTGTAEHPTPVNEEGDGWEDFRIWIKLESTTMEGPGYHLENVPFTMYFYEGYGIHGTYWHNNFGTPMSHGCVNLPNDMAEWFFYWADVGTKVIVQP